ncbi:MAG: FAD-binding oxidoreductase [Rhodobacteraceae bacterium]|nr:FAD-binding oxidoreductase [Paracoccaceae bacterium]
MRVPVAAHGPPAFPGPPPAKADVVVIGGGVIGVMTAWHLADRGLSAVVVEKGRIAAEQSSRNWGWIRAQGRDPAELPIVMEAQRLWERLDAEAGGATGLKRAGVLYLARDEAEMARYEAWTVHARAHQLDTRLVTRAEVAALVPGHAAGWVGGLWTASDARAEPWAAVPALARLAAAKGVAIVEGCAARALDLAAGRVAGVVTEAGRIACGHVVLAGGAWSALFLRNHGLVLPQLSVLATACATAPLPEVFAGNAAEARFAFRRRADGGYTLAPGDFHEFMLGPDAFRHLRAFLPQLRRDPFGSRPFESCRVLDPRPNAGRVERVRRAFAAAFPGLPEVRIAAAWGGMIDTLPDIVPVIDAAPVPGLTVATGMSGHGFGIGPGVGRVVADLVAGRAPGRDLARFRWGRFADGSAVDLGPAL